MRVKTVPAKVAAGVALGAFALVFSGCTSLLYQLDEANARVSAIQGVFAKADSVINDSVDLAEKVSEDSLTGKIMESNGDDVKVQMDALEEVTAELEGTQVIFDEFGALRLSDDYRSTYLGDLSAARQKRLEALENADNLLFRAENLASSIVDYESGINRIEQIAVKFEQLPEIDFEQPETIQLAQDILTDVSSESKTAQTELNSAAASVNVEAFTSLRDAAKDLEDVADASDGLVKIFAALLTSAEAGDLETFEASFNNLAVQLEVLVVALEKFETNFPADIIDDNSDLTTKAQSMIETWKDENFKDLFAQAEDLTEEIDALDQKINSFNAN